MPQRDKKRGVQNCQIVLWCVFFLNQILSDHLLESIRQMWTEIHLQIHLIVPLCSTIKCKLDHRRTERRTQTWQWDNCLTGANENCGKKKKKNLEFKSFQHVEDASWWDCIHSRRYSDWAFGPSLLRPLHLRTWQHMWHALIFNTINRSGFDSAFCRGSDLRTVNGGECWVGVWNRIIARTDYMNQY